MPRPPDLETRFRRSLQALGLRGAGVHLLAAVSGGADSVTLLHLLRFASGERGPRVTAAHFDHALRPESAADAEWVRGLCAGWEVPFLTARADPPPRGEAQARDQRYAFLFAAREQAGATHLATAHHADDQAETVLFRALRGTGLGGLAGIPPEDARGVVRPLLSFTRAELRAYARRHALRWREDPSNRLPGATRNRIRHELLPLAERTVAAGARRNLARLAALAREEQAAWEAALAPLLAEAVREDEGALVLVRERFTAYDWPLAARLLRAALRRLGPAPDRAGTRLALEFISHAPSGRELRLPGGVRITTEFGLARVDRAHDAPAAPAEEPLRIPADAPGEGRVRVGGREWRACWGEGDPATDAELSVAVASSRLPLLLRGWQPGDRLRTRAGRRPLKKLFAEARVPRRLRHTLPVLADAAGAVLWIPGIATAADLAPAPGEPAITLSIRDA